jgi:hypothetical protein
VPRPEILLGISSAGEGSRPRSSSVFSQLASSAPSGPVLSGGESYSGRFSFLDSYFHLLQVPTLPVHFGLVLKSSDSMIEFFLILVVFLWWFLDHVYKFGKIWVRLILVIIVLFALNLIASCFS